MEENEDIFESLYDDPNTLENNPSANPFTPEEPEEDYRQYFEEDEDEDEDNTGLNNQSADPATQESLVLELLKSKGIEGTDIQFENEDGEIEVVNFYDLSKEEQLNILKSDDSDINYGLSDDEVNTINFLRQNEASIEDVIEYYKREAVKEYIDSQSISGIQVNQYSDEELFILDLKSRYEDLSDEEIKLELDKQLEHPELFKKKIDKVRSYYEEIELKELEDAKMQSERDAEEKHEELTSNLISVAEQLEDIGGLDLDKDDKNEVLTYILHKDINGLTSFDKALEDPNLVFQMGWFLSKGQEAFQILHDYYKKEIQDVSKNSYEKGRAESKNLETKPKGGLTAVRKQQNAKPQSKVMHIDDIQIE